MWEGQEQGSGAPGLARTPLELLAHGPLSCSEWARQEVMEPLSQACWLETASGELGRLGVISEPLSKLHAEAATHSGSGEGRGECQWGPGEADTAGNLSAVLCKTLLSGQHICNKTRSSHRHCLAHSSLYPRDAGPRDLSRLPIITLTFPCGGPGEQRRV